MSTPVKPPPVRAPLKPPASALAPQKPPPAAAPLQKPPGYRDPRIRHQHPPPLRKPIKLPPSFHHTTRRSTTACRRAFCCCLCIATLLLLLVSASAAGLFYLWFQPRLPEIHLSSINFKKFNISTAPDGGPVLDSETAIAVEIKNPNRNLKMQFDRTQISLNAVDGIVDLGGQLLPGFIQGKNSVRTLKCMIKVHNENLDSESADELKEGFKSKNLMVDAELSTRVGARGSGWATGTVRVKVVCRRMRLRQVQGGGSTPKCSIRVLNLIPIN